MNSRKKRILKKAVLPIEGKFVPITFEEMDSMAFISLNGNSAKLYGYLKRAARTAAYKNGMSRQGDVQFDFTYSEAKRHGFSESTFIRAIRQLWEKGFIELVERGGLRGQGRSNSRYKLAAYWKTYGEKWTDRKMSQQDPFENTTEPKNGSEKW